MYIQPSIPPSFQQYNDLLYNKYGVVSYDRIKRIASPADKDHYTAHDALVDEYLSQFKIQCHLSFSNGILTDDYDKSTPARLSPPDIAAEDLDTFEKTLIGREFEGIDWSGASDLKNLKVSLYNAHTLTEKVNYLTSKYTILKKQIETHYNGSEKEENLAALESLYEQGKHSIAKSFADSAGAFFETYGGEGGIKEDMYSDLLAAIDSRKADYEQFASSGVDFSGITDEKDKWLLNNELYMASQLRENMPDSPEQTSESGFTLKDLCIAGIFAKQSVKQMDSIEYCPTDDYSLGWDLAVQWMKVDYLCSSMETSQKMTSLLDHAFDNYMDAYLDKVNKAVYQFSTSPLSRHDRISINRDTIMQIYDYTKGQYFQTKDIESAATAGIKEIQNKLNTIHASYGSHMYWNKINWGSYFESNYANSGRNATSFECFQKVLDVFYTSISSGKESRIQLLFAPGGKTSTWNYSSDSWPIYALYMYA